MKVRLTFLFLLMLIGGDCLLIAQTIRLRGVVRDAENGDPLVGVTISVPTDGAGTFSGDDGSYQLDIEIKNRESVDVRYAFSGYNPQTQELVLTSGAEVVQDIAMESKAYSTDDVVITATKGFEQKQSDVTVSIQVIKPQSIDLQATTEMGRVIDQIPGVDNQDGQINIRGSSGYAYGVGSRVMLTLDGLPLLTGDAGTASLDLIPVDNIAQVEVLKGASSVLYGSAALGGVINVITADPDAKPKTRIRLRGGAFDQPFNPVVDWDGDARAYNASAHIFHSRKIGNHDFTIQTDWIKDSGYRQGTDKEEFRGVLMTKFRPQKVPGLTIGLNATTRIDSSGAMLYWRAYYPDTIKGADMQDSVILGGALTPTLADGAYRKQLATLLAIDPSVKYLTPNGNLFWYRGRFLRNSNQNNANQSSSNYILYNDFLFQKSLAKNINWVSGATYTYAVANGDSLYGGLHDGHAFGVYSQLDAKFDRFNASLGLRYQYAKIDTLPSESRPIFRAGVNYELRPGSNVRASVGQAFRVPTVAERYANTAGGSILIDPNPNIQSEYGYSAEVAFRQGYRFEGASSKFLGYLDIAGFMMDYQNMVEFGIDSVELVSGPDGFAFQGRFSSKNVARARITGIEITTLNSGEWENGLFYSFSGGVTLTNPMDLNAVPDSNQMDLSAFNVDDFDFLTLTRVLNQIADPTIVDQPSVLKYRSRQLWRASASLGYKKIALTVNYRQKSQVEAIDQFLYLVVTDLNDFRTRYPNGFRVMDVIASYDVNDLAKLTLTVDNIFNQEYTIIPGYLAPQRKATLQLLLRF